MFTKIAVKLIDRYQAKGGGPTLLYVECNYNPTCSEYTKQCIERYGFWHGIVLGWKRIRRCNKRDLTKAIHDPVPQELIVRSGCTSKQEVADKVC